MPRRARPIAFMCERTAEYVLVPALRRILQCAYKSTFPFWFSAAREGSAVADVPANLRLLAVFARRPKVLVPGDREVTVKFSQILFEVARKAQNFGIPVLAGVPLISTLEGLADGPECSWFLIQDHSGSPDDVIHRIDLAERRLLTETHEDVEGPLSAERLLSHLAASTQLYSWPEAMLTLKELRRRDVQRYFYFPFGASPYRPFFFALFEEGLLRNAQPSASSRTTGFAVRR
jgi:hypothetical protein